ncbi:MAG TPA: hypothetical protein VMU16_08890 [Candidatus Binataceae bacterium]|nr:hypothetical protein [Candidatus Binataceae bacterium]
MVQIHKVIPRHLRLTPVTMFFVILFLSMWTASRVELVPGPDFRIAELAAVSGDEPTYVENTTNILFHHRLSWEYTGGGGHPHEILVNRRTGRAALRFLKDPRFITPSPDIYAVSAHPPAFPLLMAACLAPFHLSGASQDTDRFYLDAYFVMMSISWLGALVTYFIGRRIGMERGFALLTTLVLLSSPWLVYSKSYYSEPAIGLSLALALWALESRRPMLAGLAAGAAMAFKPSFVIAGAGLVLERLWARSWRDAIEMAAVLGACGIALLSFNFWLARTLLIVGSTVSVGAGNMDSFSPKGSNPLYQTMLGPGVGLLNYAPWVIFSLLALGIVLFKRSSPLRRIAFPMALYVVLLAFFNNGPSICYGPRYWVPMLPWLAIASVEGIRSMRWHSPIRYALGAGYLAAVIFGAAIAIPATLRYPQMFTYRTAFGSWHDLSAVGEKIAIPGRKEGYRTARNPGDPDYRGEQYLLGGGTVTRTGWTAASMSFDVEVTAPTVMMINQYYDSNWHVAQGNGKIGSQRGVVAVALPAGKQHIVLAYRSDRVLLGMSLALISIGAMAALWLYECHQEHLEL